MIEEFPTSGKPPADLCGEHGRIWRAWWDYARSYDPRHPKDFGNLGPIADARTTHAERRADWLRKGAQHLTEVEAMCRSGVSPQCGPRTDTRPRERTTS
jgi:hypothetical protein